jgi:ABC-type Fe3+/spermidine/putrescine transport system ATPase subunit/nucleotide-binding universal stress UspA family protein
MSIRLENISKHYGHQVVVKNLSLEVQDGEFFVLLGASGSGKTTVLNMIAGLVEPDKGEIFLHDRNVTHLPPQKRNIGFVFQNYALFQYMNVAENIEFGLQVRKVPKEKREKRRDELLEMVGLVGMGNRMPNQLSGGQQQRVTLARALALEPDVLLLDEPLGALDAKIRVELRRTLKNIQRKSGVAAILVTHDQEEAFDLGDRIGIMNFGRLIEVGTPQALYQYPQTEFVASFLGSANLWLGNIAGNEVYLGKHAFPLPADAIQLSSNSRAQILFRPEDVALGKTTEDLGCMPLGEGSIIEKSFSGDSERLRVEIPAIQGVRAISPPVPYGNPDFLMEVNRSPEQSTNMPLESGDRAWVGIRRLHVISHPGLNFLIVSDGSLRSQSAVTLGGYMARMSHAQVLLLGVGSDQIKLDAHLIDSRKQLGSGMSSLQIKTTTENISDAVISAVERQPFDLVILGWRPTAGFDQPEQILKTGEHHLLLATKPVAKLSKALICLESGEPGKDNVIFAGRILRHMGADATLMTVVPSYMDGGETYDRVERFLAGGQKSLARFGVPAKVKIKKGELLPAVLEELRTEEYDLIVLGAPLPDLSGKTSMLGAVSSVLSNVEDCSFLIVRSHQFQRLQTRFWRKL